VDLPCGGAGWLDVVLLDDEVLVVVVVEVVVAIVVIIVVIMILLPPSPSSSTLTLTLTLTSQARTGGPSMESWVCPCDHEVTR